MLQKKHEYRTDVWGSSNPIKAGITGILWGPNYTLYMSTLLRDKMIIGYFNSSKREFVISRLAQYWSRCLVLANQWVAVSCLANAKLQTLSVFGKLYF
jgi:hypothetical protein